MQREQRGRTTTTRISREEMKELDRRAKEELKAIVLPPYVPPTPEQLARRKAAGQRIDAFRESVGTVPFDVAALVREGRDEELE